MKQTVAQVWKPGYQELTKRFDLSAVISPRTLIAERILKFVRSGGNSRITSIEQGRAEIIELDLAATSPLVGKPLKDVTFPRGALVGAVVRGEAAFVPRGLDVLETGDSVIVFALTQARRNVEALAG